MKKSAQPTSTQAFTEIADLRENVVLLRGGAACTIIRVTSVNFALLSAQEQDSKVFAYASLLNSLSFPIQILVRSKPIQISPYITSLEDVFAKTTNPLLKIYIGKYKEFIASLVKETTVLDKQFYLVIPYSSLEGGVPEATLQTKAESLLSQLSRMSLQATILKKQELIKLFFDIYNQGESFAMTEKDIDNPMVKGQA